MCEKFSTIPSKMSEENSRKDSARWGGVLRILSRICDRASAKKIAALLLEKVIQSFGKVDGGKCWIILKFQMFLRKKRINIFQST